MISKCQSYGAIAALGFTAVAVPLAALASPAVSQAEDNCAYSFYMNYNTGVCEFCDDSMFWSYPANQCLAVNPDVYIGPNPIVGPVGPVGIGPDPILGPAGPVGVGGVGPVVGPVGPVGIGRR